MDLTSNFFGLCTNVKVSCQKPAGLDLQCFQKKKIWVQQDRINVQSPQDDCHPDAGQ